MTQYPEFRVGENIVFKYKIKKSKKAKYTSLRISPSEGLVVIIPFRARNFNIDNFLYSHRDWIKKKLEKIETIKSKQLLFGHELILEEQFNLFNNFSVLLNNDKLIISRPEVYNRSGQEIYEVWLKEQAENYIPERVIYLAQKYDFKFNKISIRNQKTRWGSCSSKGNLSFNYKLMCFNKKVIDYIIIHELCHLKEMNHSKNFWKLVEQIMPDYKSPKKIIRLLNN